MPDLESQLRAYGAVLDAAEPGVVETAPAAPHRNRRIAIVSFATIVAVAIVAGVVGVVATRSSSPKRPTIVTPVPTTAPAPHTTGVLAIGDSVMLGAETSLESAIPGVVVDAGVSRQGQHVAPLVARHVADGSFGTIVVDIGTNAPLATPDLDAIVQAANGRPVWFLTLRVARTWEARNNALLRALPDRHPNAHVLDWHDYANAHDEWFTADGFHLTAKGAAAYALFVTTGLGLPAPRPPSGPVPEVIRVVSSPELAPSPLAVAGGDVWVARELHTEGNHVFLDRYDPSNGRLLATIEVPQEAVFGIAGDGDTLWVAGGGDGGVSRTSVSKVDARAGRVMFTRTLTGTFCSCPIFAGRAGVWLTGNGSDFALHLSEADGHVTASVPLAARVMASAAIEIRGRLVAGLDDATIAVIDPAANRVERTIPAPTVGDAFTLYPVAMAPASIPAIGSDPPIDGVLTRANGAVDVFLGDRWVPSSVGATAAFRPAAVASSGARIALLGADHLVLATTHAVTMAEFVYDVASGAFHPVTGTSFSQESGFRDAVAVGDTLWAVYGPLILVVRIPPSLP